MTPDQHPAPQGLWLPLVTPFRDGALDAVSLRRLVRHYAAEPVEGLILAATTGEGLTLDDDEAERLVAITGEALAAAGRRLPLWLGLSGSDTRKLMKTLARTASWGVDGYLIACPYYTRPSQQGLLQHFAALADATARPILIYNIPYRTGVNLGNEAMLELAGRTNIVGVKECSADAAQSFELLRRRPPGFAVLTGEDALYYGALTQGADGGILASAHVETRAFAAIRTRLLAGDQAGALADWRRLCEVPRLLFIEPSPAPIKHWLWRLGLIDSPEVRLPMTPVTDALAARIDRAIAARQGQAAPAPDADTPVPITPADLAATGAALLALNNAHAKELSWLEPARLRHLVEQAFLARRIGAADAFLLAFDQGADYDSPNFLWFRDRYRRFVYIDRIVTAAAARGRGHARRLYEALFATAAAAGHDRVVCEVNAEPPNPASDAFHAALGFVEVGRAAIHGGDKTVRYFSRLLG
ncbi:4-hydroxy-tetrahydrodipicolinate synthase [Plastoroseomonas hellenica]|uniref:4-hydroxy-tetrahydrodipicolinate synthase n=1 Tax=Plastoroseomonas hellenica TaxID=2687306 RepID=UPI001BA4C2B6